MSNELSPKCPQCGTPLPGNAPAGLCPNCLMALNLKTETVFTDIPVTAQPPLPPEQIAPHFPQLEILECLGRGGMGVVYKARQKTLNRLVALKLLAPERVNDPKFADRFAREARALAALNHPNIVTIHDFGQAGGFYFLLMEFVDGVNLRQLLRARKFAPEEALAIVPPICEALQYAHDRGIVHRDIKPENLLLDKQGKVKIADFGIAKMLGTKNGDSISNTPENATQSALGTPGYHAPEQKNDPQRADNRADIYSLGVVFYEMLTGELPAKRIEPPSKKVQIDVRLDAVVLRALEKTPELRWQTAEELRTQIETISASCPQTGMRPRLNFSRASIAAIACGVITLIMCLLAMLAENRINSLAPEIGRLNLSLSDRYSPAIQSWSNLIHLRRYVIIPSIFIGVLAGVFFAGLAAARTPSPARKKAVFVVSILTLIALYLDITISFNGGYSLPIKSNYTGNSKQNPAENPQILETLPTEQVIQIGLTNLQITWTWQELQNRVRAAKVSTNEAEKLMTGLITLMNQNYSNGYNQPLYGLGNLLEELHKHHRISETNALAFLKAYQGDPLCQPLPRLREGDQTIQLTCNLRAPWDDQLFGFEMLNEVQTIRVDGRSIKFNSWFGHNWNQQQFSANLELPVLAPGSHTVQCDVATAFVAVSNMAGLDSNLRSVDWPPAKLRWMRSCQATLMVYPKDTVIVAPSDDPTNNPVLNGTIFIQQVIIRRTRAALNADLAFNFNPKPAPPVGVDVTLRIGGQSIKCGSLKGWAITNETGSISMTHDNTVLTAALDSLDPDVHEADIVLTPNPKLLEGTPLGVDQIWGKEIVITNIPIKREDTESETFTSASPTSLNPKDSQLDTQAGWQLWQQQKYEDAMAKFNEAVQADSNNADAWNGLGWVAFNSGHPSEAKQDFQKVLSLNPNHPAGLNGLGQIYLSQRKYDDAEKYLLQAAPQASAAWYGLARLYLLKGKYDDAEKWAQKVVDSGQGDQTANEMLKAAQNKQLPDALRKSIEPQPPSLNESQHHTLDGFMLWQAGKIHQAAIEFNNAIESDSNNAAAWNGLGWTAFNSGNWSNAEKDFQKVLSLNPTHPAALNGLGQIYLSQGKYDDAEKYLLQAAPQAPAAWYGLARLYLLEGKYDDAEKWAQKAVDSGQGDQTANDMLKAAQNKQVPDALRVLIEPQSTSADDAHQLNISGVEAVLKYKWPVGKSYVFDFDYKQDTALLLQGRSNTVDEAVTMGSQSQVTVLSGTPDGGHELELQALSARMSIKMGDDTILDYDSANESAADQTNGVANVFGQIVGSKIRYIVNASNNVEQVKGMEELVQRIQSVPQTDPLTTDVKKIFNAAFFDTFTNNNHLLPPQAVQPGDTWPSHFEHPVAGVGIEVWDYKIVFQNWEMHGNHTCARLDLQGTMNVKSDPKLKRDEKVYHPRDGVAQGISWFDPKLGQVIETDMKQDLNVDKLPRNPTPAQQGQLITTQRHVVYTFKLEE